MQCLPPAWQDRHRAYHAMFATLHALRDRLTLEEVAHLGAQLPMLVRGFYYDGWDPTGKPLKGRHKAEFLAYIAQYFKDDPTIDAERLARAVFTVLQTRVTAGEIEDSAGRKAAEPPRPRVRGVRAPRTYR